MKYSLIGDPHITHKSLDRATELNALLEYFKTSKLFHTIIVGNHDYFNLECEGHSLEALKLLPNVLVIDEPTNDEDFVFIPYMHDQQKLKATIAKFVNPKKTLIGHLELSQFDFGNGHICTTGLSVTDVAGFKRVISGHFHKYQTQGNLTYLGTPFSHSFGEANQVKYLGMYDSVTDELKIAETPFPKHISIEFNCDLLDEHGSHWFNQIDLNDPNHQKHFYRIILTGQQINIDRFPKHIYDGGTHGKLNIKWISRPSDYMENQITIEDTVSNERQFMKWATEVRGMDEETVKLGLSIMEACR